MTCKRCGFDHRNLEKFDPRYCIRCGERLETEEESHEEETLTISDVSRILRLSKGSIYQYVRRNKIPAFKVGRALRFNTSEIKKLRGEKEEKN